MEFSDRHEMRNEHETVHLYNYYTYMRYVQLTLCIISGFLGS